jgi:hypothetical protein
MAGKRGERFQKEQPADKRRAERLDMRLLYYQNTRFNANSKTVLIGCRYSEEFERVRVGAHGINSGQMVILSRLEDPSLTDRERLAGILPKTICAVTFKDIDEVLHPDQVNDLGVTRFCEAVLDRIPIPRLVAIGAWRIGEGLMRQVIVGHDESGALSWFAATVTSNDLPWLTEKPRQADRERGGMNRNG